MRQVSLLLANFCAGSLDKPLAAVSDCCSNSLRVIKTTKQTSPQRISYVEAVQVRRKRERRGGCWDEDDDETKEEELGWWLW